MSTYLFLKVSLGACSTPRCGAQKAINIVAHAPTVADPSFSSTELHTFESRCLSKYPGMEAGVCSLHDPRGFAVLTAKATDPDRIATEAVLEWRIFGRNPFGVPLWGLQDYRGDLPNDRVPVIEEMHKPWSVDPGPGMGYIVRAESRLFDLGPSTDVFPFQIPSGYHRVRSLPSYWKHQN